MIFSHSTDDLFPLALVILLVEGLDEAERAVALDGAARLGLGHRVECRHGGLDQRRDRGDVLALGGPHEDEALCADDLHLVVARAHLDDLLRGDARQLGHELHRLGDGRAEADEGHAVALAARRLGLADAGHQAAEEQGHLGAGGRGLEVDLVQHHHRGRAEARGAEEVLVAAAEQAPVERLGGGHEDIGRLRLHDPPRART